MSAILKRQTPLPQRASSSLGSASKKTALKTRWWSMKIHQQPPSLLALPLPLLLPQVNANTSASTVAESSLIHKHSVATRTLTRKSVNNSSVPSYRPPETPPFRSCGTPSSPPSPLLRTFLLRRRAPSWSPRPRPPGSTCRHVPRLLPSTCQYHTVVCSHRRTAKP